MAKAARVLAALQRDGWKVMRRPRGGSSHMTLGKGSKRETWAYHDSRDLGQVHLAQTARKFGYTLEELRKLI